MVYSLLENPRERKKTPLGNASLSFSKGNFKTEEYVREASLRTRGQMSPGTFPGGECVSVLFFPTDAPPDRYFVIA